MAGNGTFSDSRTAIVFLSINGSAHTAFTKHGPETHQGNPATHTPIEHTLRYRSTNRASGFDTTIADNRPRQVIAMSRGRRESFARSDIRGPSGKSNGLRSDSTSGQQLKNPVEAHIKRRMARSPRTIATNQTPSNPIRGRSLAVFGNLAEADSDCDGGATPARGVVTGRGGEGGRADPATLRF